jgi:hypothetical protein
MSFLHTQPVGQYDVSLHVISAPSFGFSNSAVQEKKQKSNARNSDVIAAFKNINFLPAV